MLKLARGNTRSRSDQIRIILKRSLILVCTVCLNCLSENLWSLQWLPFEPRREKTGLRGFRPGPTQTGLYSHRRWLETFNFEFRFCRMIVLSKWRKQRRWSASRLPRSWSASLFSHMQKSGFLTSRLIYQNELHYTPKPCLQHILSWLGHENISMSNFSLVLIQGLQLSVNSERNQNVC